MATGKVKFLNMADGYGFITLKNSKDIAFFHREDVQNTDFQTLAEGAKVKCTLVHGPNGAKAIDVIVKQPCQE